MEIKKIKTRSVLFTYMVSDWELNLHLIKGNRYNYIIDTGLGSLSVEPIKEYIMHDEKPIIVVNTHYHWDHIWGNDSFQDNMIISHKLCRELIESKWDEMMGKSMKYINGDAKICLPNVVFDHELYFPEDKIKMIYTPGHTIDSISVIDEEDKLINMGDNVGDTLEEIVPSIFSEKEIYRNTLLRYQGMDFDTCISGHNMVLGRDVVETILHKL